MNVLSRLRKIERHISTPHHPVPNGAAESDREERYNTHINNVDNDNSNKDSHAEKNSEEGSSRKNGGGSDDVTR